MLKRKLVWGNCIGNAYIYQEKNEDDAKDKSTIWHDVLVSENNENTRKHTNIEIIIFYIYRHWMTLFIYK